MTKTKVKTRQHQARHKSTNPVYCCPQLLPLRSWWPLRVLWTCVNNGKWYLVLMNVVWLFAMSTRLSVQRPTTNDTATNNFACMTLKLFRQWSAVATCSTPLSEPVGLVSSTSGVIPWSLAVCPSANCISRGSSFRADVAGLNVVSSVFSYLSLSNREGSSLATSVGKVLKTCSSVDWQLVLSSEWL